MKEKAMLKARTATASSKADAIHVRLTRRLSVVFWALAEFIHFVRCVRNGSQKRRLVYEIESRPRPSPYVARGDAAAAAAGAAATVVHSPPRAARRLTTHT